MSPEHELEVLLRTMREIRVGFQIIGFDWRYIYVNAAAAAHGRRTVAELQGRTMMELYPGIEQTDMFGVLRRCMEQRVRMNSTTCSRFQTVDRAGSRFAWNRFRRGFASIRSTSTSESCGNSKSKVAPRHSA
jgi:hypothetical protein